MAEPLTTDRIRMFYSHATGWSMPGAWRNKPKREARLAAVRAQTEAEFDAWLAEHDREVAAKAWDEGNLFGMREESVIPASNPYRLSDDSETP